MLVVVRWDVAIVLPSTRMPELKIRDGWPMVGNDCCPGDECRTKWAKPSSSAVPHAWNLAVMGWLGYGPRAG
jgi:hypothetical protein